MDIRKVKKLIELLEESNLTEIEIVEGEESVRLIREGQAPVAPVAMPQQVIAAPPVAAAAAVEAEDDADQLPDGEPVLAPMVGTFYAASGPEAESFVKLGQSVGHLVLVSASWLRSSDMGGAGLQINCSHNEYEDGVNLGWCWWYAR